MVYIVITSILRASPEEAHPSLKEFLGRLQHCRVKSVCQWNRQHQRHS